MRITISRLVNIELTEQEAQLLKSYIAAHPEPVPELFSLLERKLSSMEIFNLQPYPYKSTVTIINCEEKLTS